MICLTCGGDPCPNPNFCKICRQADRKHRPPGPAAHALPFRLFDDIAAEPLARRWLFKGIMARGETSAWIAPPGGLKSALMAEASVCAAAGLDWHGKRSKGPVGVVYFALERADLVLRRLQAHRERMNLSRLPIAVVSTTFNLMSEKTVPTVVATIREAEVCFGMPVGLVNFDTFAKLIAAGGGDEDKAKDQGAVFANVQRIKEQTDVHVALVGHTGKDESRGARGSNAILGDADVMVKLTGDQIRTATILKANELPEGPLFNFKSELHQLGQDEDGDAITINIACHSDDDGNPAGSEPRLTKNQRTMFSILHDAGSSGLSIEDWNERAREAGLGTGRKADLFDFRSALEAKHLVRKADCRWKVT
jgi:hypothetical protein